MSASVVDQTPGFTDLVDLATVRQVAESFTVLCGLGFQLVDAAGNVLVGAEAAASRRALCRFVNREPAGAQACAATLAIVRAATPEIGGAPVTADCFTGFRYAAAALTHDGSRLGTVIVGPYLPGTPAPRTIEALPAALVSLVSAPRRARALAQLVKARATSDERARRLVEHARAVLGALIHAGVARFFTSAVHAESVKESSREIAEQTTKVAALTERLKETDRLKASFLATMTHELRTPLTSVIGYSEMLLGGLAGPVASEQREYIQTIMGKGEELLGLISSLIDTARAGSGTLRVRGDALDLGELVTRALIAVRPLADRRKLRLTSEVEPGLPRVLADRDKLRQVLLNLLGNAVKFTPEGGTVVVSAQVGRLDDRDRSAGPFSPDDAIRLAVRDTGIGMDKEHLEKVFEPFYQVDGTTTREYPGAGIGLALVRNFVRVMGGRAWAESTSGQGSTFFVTLPLSSVR